jgi:hypothetical protein
MLHLAKQNLKDEKNPIIRFFHYFFGELFFR